MGYEITVTEPGDQLSRLSATGPGVEDIKVTVLPNKTSTRSTKQATSKLQRLNRKEAKLLADKDAKAGAKQKMKVKAGKGDSVGGVNYPVIRIKPSTTAIILQSTSVLYRIFERISCAIFAIGNFVVQLILQATTSAGSTSRLLVRFVIMRTRLK